MREIVPDYYKNFKCVGGSCRHNCCIGWEIDIDGDTAAYYDTVSGEMGCRLQKNIEWDDEPHFRLGEGERCPFLNRDNLCDIILNLGEEHICEICTEHPRFHNDLGDRMETGLGLCCEEAGRLILGWKEPVRLEGCCEADGCTGLEMCGEAVDCVGVSGCDAAGAADEAAVSAGAQEGEETAYFLRLRNAVIRILQDRTMPVPERVSRMLQFCGASVPDRSLEEWADFLLDLERLDETWTKVLNFLKNNAGQADFYGFDRYMSGRQTEYEQLLVYLVYRHMAAAYDELDLAARAAFAAFGYELLYAAGAAVWTVTGEFPFEAQVELARLFSSEIEYSEENLDAVLDEMVGDFS